MKKGIIYGRGEYPLGSSALRIRMWYKGLKANGIDTLLIINTPAPSFEDVENSEDFVHFMLSPDRKDNDSKDKSSKGIHTILSLLQGLVKSYSFMKQRINEVDFVFLYSSNVLEGLLVKRYCRKHKKSFFIESCDENRNRYKENKTFFESLAVWQEDLFEKLVVPKADMQLVVSE
ncbi:MAG: hypothetical protein JEZ03_02020, partial [Bacteroidales bacterium]|nr:hypothetical protein [Bacteroidales bacterium]